MIRQLSVFIENKQGSLANTAGILAKNNINIRAMSLADTDKYGVLRMIVDNLDAAQNALTEAGYLTRANDVVAVLMPDTAGALHDVIALLDEVGVNVEYLYAFNHGKASNAYVVLRVHDPALTDESLTAKGFKVLDANALATM
jgi:hypothetical protein